MSKRCLISVLCIVLLSICAAPVSFALDAPSYHFDAPKSDELYDASGVVTAQSGPQIVLPDDIRETVLPYGVIPFGVTYGGTSASPSTTFTADGYPDVWIDAAYSYVAPLASYSQSDLTLLDLTQANGSLGTLAIPSIGLSTKVYENDMSGGVGHLPGTAFWNGNIGLCGHNRGTPYSIGGIKDLRIGDTIEYTTVYGTRTYAVSYVGTIADTDWSWLSATSDNRITLITCLADHPSVRVCVQAVEK